MTDQTNAIAAVSASVAADIKAFRSSAVSSENKANVSARSLLAALVSGNWTRSLAESAIITAFGNPKSPKSGKPVAKLSGLRDFTGGDAVRKMAETVFGIYENIDVDAPKLNEETGETVGAGAVRPLIVAFILSDDKQSLRSLDAAVKAAVKAHSVAISPDNSEAASETASETEAAASEPTVSLVDRINMLTVAIGAASDDELAAAYEAMDAFVAAYDARIAASTAPVALAA